MKTTLLIALAATSLLSGCSRPSLPFLEVDQKYTFFFENDRNWIRGKILERTDDGWVLIKYEGSLRWINGNQTLMIQPEN